MRNRSLATLALLLFAVTLPLAGCAKKKAPTTRVSGDAVAAPPVQTVAPEPASRDLGAADPRESPLDGDLVAATEHAYSSGLLGDVYFAFDESTLEPAARERLAKNAQFLRDRPEFLVLIEGHCDERGTEEYNLALGERRAQAARDYLASLGIGASRLRTLTYGEGRPVCGESAESCWQLNRRAHFLLVGRAGAG